MVFRPDELEAIEYADFGLNDFEREGLSLIIYDNNERYCAKELVLLPEQICPEHRHPERNGKPGQQFVISPNTKHWFKAGPEGAIVSEFSSSSDDASDIFTDPNIRRVEP